jgi:fumarate reductase subunit C
MKVESRRPYPVYSPEVPRWWWLETAPYRRFVARELTSVFVAVFSVILLLFLFAVSRGREAYEGFLRWLESPASVLLHVVILVAVLYHTLTSIILAAQLQDLRLGGNPVPRRLVMAGLVGAWLVASVIVAYFHLWA